MLRKIMGAMLWMCMLLAGASLAEDGDPQPYTGELISTWGFAGGAEEHGDGFRLNADGTGVHLEIIDYDQVPPQYRETDSTFTWEVFTGGGCTLLAETDGDGRVSAYEIEIYGDARIHIPNEVSGGFYYPVLDDEAQAYLADKAEPSAFDGVIADYLDGSITGKIEAAGLHVGEIYLQQEAGAWRIVFSSYDAERKAEIRLILDEQYIDVYADKWVWLWGDYDLGQRWFAPDTTERYYAGLTGILESYLTRAYSTPQPTPEPTPAALPELTARLGTFPKKKTYPVYETFTGGDEGNRRAGKGKAKVSTNGDIWVYATWRGHLLIEYEIATSRHRIGWIDASKLPASVLAGAPELPWSWETEQNIYGVTTLPSIMTDDPLESLMGIASVPAGTSLHVLASLDKWLLVQCFVGEGLRTGFVLRDRVDLEHGYAANPAWQIGSNTRYTEEDVYAAFDALAQCIYQQWPGTGLAAVRYDENDADYANPNTWWTDETGTKEGILLLADLSSMELYHFEIGGPLTTDYIFLLYREPGGEWKVCNWGYT